MKKGALISISLIAGALFIQSCASGDYRAALDYEEYSKEEPDFPAWEESLDEEPRIEGRSSKHFFLNI